MTTPVQDWEGRIILVYLRDSGSPTQAGIALASPTLEELWGDQFVVGHVPEHERDWAGGLRVAVRWRDVVHILIFESMEEYVERVASAPAHWELSARSPT